MEQIKAFRSIDGTIHLTENEAQQQDKVILINKIFIDRIDMVQISRNSKLDNKQSIEENKNIIRTTIKLNIDEYITEINKLRNNISVTQENKHLLLDSASLENNNKKSNKK